MLCRSDRYLAVHSRFFMREIRVIAYQQFLESYRVRQTVRLLGTVCRSTALTRLRWLPRSHRRD